MILSLPGLMVSSYFFKLYPDRIYYVILFMDPNTKKGTIINSNIKEKPPYLISDFGTMDPICKRGVVFNQDPINYKFIA